MMDKVIDCVGFREYDKSFRVGFDNFIGPIHFIEDDKETAMKKVAELVRMVRIYQHEQDMRSLRALTPPYEND